MISKILKKIVPEDIKKRYRIYQQEKFKKKIAALPPIDEAQFKAILTDKMNLQIGDLVMIHASVGQLNLTFPFYKILSILRDVIGEEGTMVFPTYPEETSYKFLKEGGTFNIKRSASFTGALSEFARRQPGAKRSMHPIKSVAAIGPLAEELVSEHHLSVYPYDQCSPYYKIFEHKAKIIGIGVRTTYLSAVHTVDDYLKADFPVWPYHDELFEVECKDYDKSTKIVKTYAHNMDKMNFSLPDYFANHISDEIVRDFKVNGADFFFAQSDKMFEEMLANAKKGITIYKKSHLSKGWK